MMKKVSCYLSAENLAVGYDKKTVVKDIEISLKPGEILALVGPNGSGKSTVLKSLVRQLKLLNGEVRIREVPVGRMKDLEFAREAAIVFPGRIQTEQMNCRDVVAAGRYPYTGRMGVLGERDWNAVYDAMEAADVRELENREFGRISDGQRQRVLLARALCQEPGVIVLDEPTNYLDIRYRQELLTLLRRLAEEKKIAAVVSLHELSAAQKVADFVMGIRDGKVICCGTAEELLKEELVCRLYGLEPDSYEPLSGSVELKRPEGLPRVFVMAGGGSGTGIYRMLQKKGIGFCTGIFSRGDMDAPAARALASKVIWEKNFEPVGEDAYREAWQELEACGCFVNCLKEYGSVNAKCRELYLEAKKRGLKEIFPEKEGWWREVPEERKGNQSETDR